ncbi:hypothetical protein [Flavobacterium humi]|uniref:DUF1761 domain-containing protein n=1 Tax=Flavobacterium humi TaxID=2562683 RepID=A0A4Z0LDD4_9FLAO|nr:hypothetical protein [Flavobacterium humi]TGD59863.1 hypothetical protein E4635_02730 [Flavobacterium humi]
MNLKNFFIAGIVGGIVDFLLGWILYGMIFTDIYPQNEHTKLHFIFLGCMTFGFFISYLYIRWAGITTPKIGLATGLIIGFFNSLAMNFFMYSSMEFNMQNMLSDIFASIIIGGGVGGAVAFVNGKLK